MVVRQLMIRTREPGYIGAHLSWLDARATTQLARLRATGHSEGARLHVRGMEESHCVESGVGRGVSRAGRSPLGGRVCAPASCADQCHLYARGVRCLAGGGRERVRVQRAGKRGTGVRHGPGPECSDVAAELERRDRVHAERGLARRAAVPERDAGSRLPGSPRPRTGEDVGTDHRPLGRRGAVGSQHLRPGNPRQRIHVPDDA